MREVHLYIKNERISLFKDEEISITQSIQNIKDPAKIFTDFSKTFTLPANSDNNKIFKHYYNFDISNGFDARLKVPAEIKLNYVSFRKGYIKLEGVDLKDNKPNLYRVTFFGETVSLKDLLGEDKLNALTWLDNFALQYSTTNIKAYLQNGYSPTVSGIVYADAIVVPLITHTSRLFYDSTSGHELAEDFKNNLYYDTGTDHVHGVLYSDLKYSVRVHLIIKAIEEHYGIAFSTDFFNVSNSDYYNLYMWMHRKKGDVAGEVSGTPIYSKLVDSFSNFNLNSGDVVCDGSNFEIQNIDEQVLTVLTLDPVNDSTLYNLKIYKDGALFISQLNISGNQSYNFDFLTQGTYTLFIESTESISFNLISWHFYLEEYDFDLGWIPAGDSDASTATFSLSPLFTFYPTRQLPEIKVIDFLTGIFKMFNLTAYVLNDKIVVDTLDNYYATFEAYDITSYVDIESTSVNAALPYKQITLGYQDYNTYLAAIFNQLNAYEFGELKYKGEDDLKFSGSDYSIILPFQQMLYERLTNLNGGALTTIQWGWMADDNQSPYIGKPLIHYVKRQTTSTTALSFRDTDLTHSSLSTYYIPLNFNGITGTDQSLHFNAEIDEYALSVNEETLFKNYYLTYIQDIFNKRKRLFKIKAFLPLKVLLNFNLSDRFIVNGKRHFINSIDTKLQTGESQIELLNEV